VHQLHSARYRRPGELPDGWVLVVGAGPSGQQIAAELRRAGREVVLAVGRHARMPRRYRGRDIFDWLAESGQLDVGASEVPDLAAARRAASFPVSGAGGGESLGLDRLAGLGVAITGRLLGFAGRHALFAADNLDREVAEADRRMRRVLARIDAHIESREGRLAAPGPSLPLPAEHPPAFELPPGPSRLDLGAGVRTILWATGYGRSYPWLEVPVLDDAGELVHCEGVTAAPGLFALGLRFQRTRRSHFLGGVGADAAFIAAEIARRAGGAGLLPRAA
jgi:putative flavoprotein involved in K+ transport